MELEKLLIPRHGFVSHSDAVAIFWKGILLFYGFVCNRQEHWKPLFPKAFLSGSPQIVFPVPVVLLVQGLQGFQVTPV